MGLTKSEKARITRKTEQVLNALRSAGDLGLTNADLSKIALRYGANLGDLYKDGYVIERINLGDGLFNYKLVSEPDTIIIREKAISKLISEINKLGAVDSDSLLKLLDSNNITVKYKANTYKGGK